jgi:hypothetical protein
MAPLPFGEVKAEVKRMAGLDFFPQEPEAVRELVDVLATRCAHVEHVRAVVGHCLERLTQTPKPVELLEVIDRTRPVSIRAAQGSCSICGGSGFVTVGRLVQVAGVGGYQADFAAPCGCRLGPG